MTNFFDRQSPDVPSAALFDEKPFGKGRLRLLFAAAMQICVWTASVGLASESTSRPFTVRDSIEWTRLIGASDESVAGVGTSDIALFSPSRKYFLVHTRRGSVDNDALIDQLLLWDSGMIKAYLKLAPSAPAPRPIIVAERRTTVDLARLSHVQWLDDGRIAFQAEGADGIVHPFIADWQNRTLQEFPVTGVLSTFAADKERILYLAHSTPEAQFVRTPVPGQRLVDLLFGTGSDNTPVHLNELLRSSGQSRRLSLPLMHVNEYFQKLSISPAGLSAVVTTPATAAPPYWAEYQVRDYETYGYTSGVVSADPTSPLLTLRTRYTLVDLVTDASRPLLDAPAGFLSQNQTPAHVFWLADGLSVVVSNTYLPLRACEPDERARRALRPATAEVSVINGQVTPIFFEPAVTDAEVSAGKHQDSVITAMSWDQMASRLTVHRRRSGRDLVPEVYIKSDGQWRKEEGSELRSVKVTMRQSSSSRPKVYVSNGHGQRKLLFDPNPAGDSFRFGRVEQVSWREVSAGIDWKGGLVFPVDEERGGVYPLIVQTHGYNTDEFLLDGPWGGTTAMAAQALSNAGFLVLQIDDSAAAFTEDDQEAPRFVNGFRAGIDMLIRRGLVDQGRIGMIAFSRTGFYAVHMLAKFPKLLAAVDISDAIQPGYLGYLLEANAAPERIQSLARLFGGLPRFGGMDEWFSRNALGGLANTTAAVRVEAIAPWSLLGMWETYATLRSSQRVVDLVYFPEGSHVLIKPSERLASQGGSVDWFRYWLLGQEDEDPRKANQYERWRKLRAQRDLAAP